MSPNFIQQWADAKPETRWPVVIVLMIALLLLGCSVDSEYEAERASFITECHRMHGERAQVLETKDGDTVCRRKSGAST